MTIDKQILFSGMQPSGAITLGNYLGALKNWISLQNEYHCLFSLVDLHSITVNQDPKMLSQFCYNILAAYIAAGINPEKNIIFLQSNVHEHTQLSWILNCYTYIGELTRMTQFKDKIKKNIKNINAGLLNYPVLMSSDILLYQTSLVPVGIDQKQHIELARNIAVRFNNKYGKVFTVPKSQISSGSKIMSLQNPIKKMSKSDNDINATIFLLDSENEILRKFKKAVTDSGKDILFDCEKKPGISNLLTILSSISGVEICNLELELKRKTYSDLKKLVANEIITFLKPFQYNYYHIRNDIKYLSNILKEGSEKARKLALNTLNKVYDVLGIINH